MATNVVRTGAEYRVGRVFGRAAGIWASHVVPFTLIALLAVLPASLPRLLAVTYHPAARQALAYLPIALTNLVTGPLSHAVFVILVLQALAGETLRIGAATRQSFSRILPLLGCGFCAILATVGGMLLLVIPGLIVITMLAVSTQACVIERLGPIASLTRSAALTKGNRWRVFGLLLLIGLLSAGVGLLANPLQRHFGLAGAIIAYLASGVLVAYIDTVYAVQFHDLRVAKEGIGTERIAAVFD